MHLASHCGAGQLSHLVFGGSTSQLGDQTVSGVLQLTGSVVNNLPASVIGN